MYSYDDRIRAVRLYIKLGKHITATLCQLGYPTKNALKRWYREYVSTSIEKGPTLVLGHQLKRGPPVQFFCSVS